MFHRTLLAAALGGVLGSIAAIIAVILAVFYYRKKNRKPVEIDPEPVDPPTAFITYPISQPDPLSSWSSTALQPRGGSIHPQTDSTWLPPMPPNPTRPPKVITTTNIPTSSPATLQSQNLSSGQPHQPAEAEDITGAFVASAHAPTDAHPAGVPTHFTEQQIELVHSMIRNKVSISAVSGVIEEMLKREGPSGGGEGSSHRITQRDGVYDGVGNPPGYDF